MHRVFAKFGMNRCRWFKVPMNERNCINVCGLINLMDSIFENCGEKPFPIIS